MSGKGKFEQKGLIEWKMRVFFIYDDDDGRRHFYWDAYRYIPL